jgi:hypothetical protein
MNAKKVGRLPTPVIIMGEFNGHSLLRGNKQTNDKGKTLKTVRKDYIFAHTKDLKYIQHYVIKFVSAV